MGELHTRKDIPITWDMVMKIQKELNSHVRAWLLMTDAGAQFSHENRFRETCTSEAGAPANMYLLPVSLQTHFIADVKPGLRPMGGP